MSPARIYESTDTESIGPHPSIIQLARLYISETKLQDYLASTGVPESKEDLVRLHGVAWIDSVRKALRLPIRTFDTAVIYYHKFRLARQDNDYGFMDAVAAAALFTACKVEDTLKRSKEILCAAHNLKLPQAEHLTQDDSRFEQQSKSVVGLERLMLESSAFDFRSQSPQRIVVKLAKSYKTNQRTVGKTAFDMSLDIYRTFAPLKQTTQTMAMACVELAGRLHNEPVEALEASRGLRRWRTSREEVMETLLDLLDLYTHHRASTVVGQEYTIEAFIAIRISLNQESTAGKIMRHCQPYEPTEGLTNGSSKPVNGTLGDLRKSSSNHSPTSPGESRLSQSKSAKGEDGSEASPSTPRREKNALAQSTVRFMLDGERAKDEKKIVDTYFTAEEEEYEVEVEVEKDNEDRGEREAEREQDRVRERDVDKDRDRDRVVVDRDRDRDRGWGRERDTHYRGRR